MPVFLLQRVHCVSIRDTTGKTTSCTRSNKQKNISNFLMYRIRQNSGRTPVGPGTMKADLCMVCVYHGKYLYLAVCYLATKKKKISHTNRMVIIPTLFPTLFEHFGAFRPPLGASTWRVVAFASTWRVVAFRDAPNATQRTTTSPQWMRFSLVFTREIPTFDKHFGNIFTG